MPCNVFDVAGVQDIMLFMVVQVVLSTEKDSTNIDVSQTYWSYAKWLLYYSL